MENVKSAPDLTEEIRNKYIPNEFLYYKKRKRYIDVLCSHCGESYVVDTYSDTEDMLYDDADQIWHNNAGKCRLCHAKAVYKAKGKARNPYYVYDTVLYGRKFKGNVAIWVINIEKIFTNEQQAKISQHAKALIIFEKGKAPVKYIKEYDYGNEKFFHRFESGKFGNIPVGRSIHSSVWATINNSYLKYFGIKELFEKMQTYRQNNYFSYSEGNIRVLRACAKCSIYPEIEYLKKQNKTKLVMGLLEDRVEFDRRKKTPWDRMGIYKERMKDVEMVCQLDFYREEKKNGLHYSEEDAKILSRMGIRDRQYTIRIMKYASLKQQAKYMRKKDRRIFIWADYLDMKEAAGYKMDSIDIFPKNLIEAHDRMIWECDRENTNKRAQEMNAKFKKISTIYNREHQRFEFEENGLTIRMARNAGEIVEEGSTLHHCVGASDTYFRKHEKNLSYIMFIRKKPDRSYITVEFDQKNLRVLQWYGIHDTKPDEKEIEDFLKDFVVHLKEGKKKAC